MAHPAVEIERTLLIRESQTDRLALHSKHGAAFLDVFSDAGLQVHFAMFFRRCLFEFFQSQFDQGFYFHRLISPENIEQNIFPWQRSWALILWQDYFDAAIFYASIIIFTYLICVSTDGTFILTVTIKFFLCSSPSDTSYFFGIEDLPSPTLP